MCNCNNFGSNGKPMLYLSVVIHYQVLLCLDTYDGRYGNKQAM